MLPQVIKDLPSHHTHPSLPHMPTHPPASTCTHPSTPAHHVFSYQVVNVFSLWTILLLTDFSSMGCYQSLLYLGVGMAVIGYEAVLGVVRVQDYFKAKYTR